MKILTTLFDKWFVLLLAALLLSCSEKKEDINDIDSKEEVLDYSPTDDGNHTTSVPDEITEPAKQQQTDLSRGSVVMSVDIDSLAKENSHEQTNKVDKYLIGDLDFSVDDKFVKVPQEYASKEIYLRKETLNAFLKMAKHAAQDGIDLTIVSGARNFNHQRRIWERKWNDSDIQDPVARAKHILKYSSMPMTSRHHWGTDIDINNLNNHYFESGKGLQEYLWLQNNAPIYGFCQVYTDKVKTNRAGYEMEKWHWSYMTLANQLLVAYINQIDYSQISGFQGSEVVQEIDVIQNYVKGVAGCKQ